MAFTTPTATQFLEKANYPEFAPSATSIFDEDAIQGFLDDAADEICQPALVSESNWQKAVMCLAAHEMTLRRGGGTMGGRGGGPVTSRSAGNVTASYGDPGVPAPYGATNYGVTYYRRFVLRYGTLRFPS